MGAATWLRSAPAGADAGYIGAYAQSVVRGDFDGDGFDEVAYGDPHRSADIGAVDVVDASGTTITWTRNSSGVLGTDLAGQLFGAALAAADLDGDGYDDLVIGVPGDTVGSLARAGSIHVLYGSASGLTSAGDQIWHQDSSGIQGAAEAGDEFGASLTAGDFDCDGYEDLAVGAPAEAISSTGEAGAVHAIYGSASGVSSVDDLWYQAYGGVDDQSERFDHFGAALAAGNFDGDVVSSNDCDDLAIGAPDEDTTDGEDTGWVYAIYGGSTGLASSGDQAFDQSAAGLEGDRAGGDGFGARLWVDSIEGADGLTIEVPGEDCDSDGLPTVAHQRLLGSSTGLTGVGSTLSCKVVPADLLRLPDPIAWTMDATSGLRYRRATSSERVANRWPEGTYLVEVTNALLADLATGAAAVTFPVVPERDRQLRELDLALVSDETGHEMLSLTSDGQGGAEVTTETPVFHTYRTLATETSSGWELDGALVSFVATDGGQGLGYGHVQRTIADGSARLALLEVDAPSVGWQLDVLPGGTGLAGENVLAIKWGNTPKDGPTPFDTPSQLCLPVPCAADPPWEDPGDPCSSCEGAGDGGGPNGGTDQCMDNVDNDDDGFTDRTGGNGDPFDENCRHTDLCDPANGYPEHEHVKESGKYFSLFTEITWCTEHLSSWQPRILYRAAAIRTVVNNSHTPNPDYHDYLEGLPNS